MPENNIILFPQPKSYVVSVSLETGCYRHIQINAASTLEQLHKAILDAFAFDDDHLHAFYMSNRAWDPYDCYVSQHAEEGPFTNTVTLTKAGLAEGKKFIYIYDFGAEWRFACRVLREIEGATPQPFCVRTKGEPPAQYDDTDEWDEDDDFMPDDQMIEQLMELWQHLAVSTKEPAETLRETLACRDKSDLVNLLEEFGAKKISRWSREKLIEGIVGYLLKPDVLRDRILHFGRQQWIFFKEAASQPVFPMAELRPELCAFPHLLGLLQPYRSMKGAYCCVVPQEIRMTLDNLLKEGLEADLERCWRVDDYAAAAVNLYGIIPVAELIELFNDQNDQKIERSELFSMLERRITGPEACYSLWQNDQYLVHEALWGDDFAVAESFLVRMEGKPRYLPTQDELLRYVDPTYYEQTLQMKALENYFATQHGLNAEQLEDVLLRTHELVFSEKHAIETIEMLADEYGIMLNTKNAKKILKLLANVMSHTRLWINKGHTPSEMHFIQTGTPPAPVRIHVKVGRNEPCPCGSGKKYKHCCGK